MVMRYRKSEMNLPKVDDINSSGSLCADEGADDAEAVGAYIGCFLTDDKASYMRKKQICPHSKECKEGFG